MKNDHFLDKIIAFASVNHQVRTVVLNGSRANKQANLDDYSDYDITFYVKASETFNALKLIKELGEIVIMQELSEQLFPEKTKIIGYIYLVQYKDKIRLDLSIVDEKDRRIHLKQKDYRKVLLDKDNYKIKEDIEGVFTIKKPTQAYFDACVKNFYWVSLYVAKGLMRNHLLYAYEHLSIMRTSLNAMIEWFIGNNHNFDIEVGKCGQKYQDYLPKDYYLMYLDTFTRLTKEDLFKALDKMLKLFYMLSDDCSKKLSYPLKVSYEDITAYLKDYSIFKTHKCYI